MFGDVVLTAPKPMRPPRPWACCWAREASCGRCAIARSGLSLLEGPLKLRGGGQREGGGFQRSLLLLSLLTAPTVQLWVYSPRRRWSKQAVASADSHVGKTNEKKGKQKHAQLTFGDDIQHTPAVAIADGALHGVRHLRPSHMHRFSCMDWRLHPLNSTPLKSSQVKSTQVKSTQLKSTRVKRGQTIKEKPKSTHRVFPSETRAGRRLRLDVGQLRDGLHHDALA
eukprot:scaffold3685_cov242-Pinguiococcus_pyrenoidosus.AAC.14